MKRTLLVTSALAFAGALAAGPALASDKLALGLGGYMQQWIGTADRADNRSEGGIDIQSDSEVYFQGSMKSDTGITYGVHVQLEANQDSNKAAQIDESFAYVSGEFGRIEIGARDPIHARMHYGIKDVGVGLNAGDTQKWIPGAYLDTNGWIGDNLNVIYISPRMNGVQVGLSYGADSTSEKSVASAPNGNDNSVMAAGINLNQQVADASVKISVGHRAAGTAADDDTFTNVGFAVGMGEFGFNVAYAERDMGSGKASEQWTVTGVSVSYSDGPMSVSLGHQMHDYESGAERSAMMLSGSYSLAPGIAWRTSIFAAADDTVAPAENSNEDAEVEGTAFVTGITLSF